MKSQKLLIPFFAIVVLCTISFVSAADLVDNETLTTEFNGVTLNQDVNLVIDSDAKIQVVFTAIKDASDVEVKVEVMGESETLYVGDIINGSTYQKTLTLESLTGIDTLTEEYTFYVSIFNNVDKTELSYTVTIQRESYELSLLSADYSTQVTAGDVFPVSVVLKNIGYHRADDVYVEVSLPELAISTRGYVGDLVPLDNVDDEEDSQETTVYLRIPESVKAGVYTLVVRSYDRDGETETVVNKLISITETAATRVIPTVKNQDLTAGKSTAYELIVVNNGDNVKTVPLTTISGSALIISGPSLVTVNPHSSETVSIEVTQSDEAKVGTYTFTAEVDGKQVVFTANVIGRGSMSSSIIALTAVLAIIFVVLLVVLVVLISKKDKPVEEVETSYY